MNARGGDGAEVIYSLRGNDKLPNLILKNLEKEGQNIRKAYTRKLPSNPNKDYYFIHRNTGLTEPIIVEYGFLDSTKDDVSQLKNNWQNYAEAVVKSISEYLNVPYSPALSDDMYIVKRGDTLWSIAKKYGISVSELKQINNLNTNMLSVGMQLRLKNNNLNNTYQVKLGDTLWNIAKVYNTTVEDLKRINNLTSNILKPGEILKLSLSDNMYTVKSGDTLWNIAKKFNTTVDSLKKINNLISDSLVINQVLRIK